MSLLPQSTIKQGNSFEKVGNNNLNNRLYESSNVFAVFELINNWLGVLKENKKSIATNFDFAYFFKGNIVILINNY